MKREILGIIFTLFLFSSVCALVEPGWTGPNVCRDPADYHSGFENGLNEEYIDSMPNIFFGTQNIVYADVTATSWRCQPDSGYYCDPLHCIDGPGGDFYLPQCSLGAYNYPYYWVIGNKGIFTDFDGYGGEASTGKAALFSFTKYPAHYFSILVSAETETQIIAYDENWPPTESGVAEKTTGTNSMTRLTVEAPYIDMVSVEHVQRNVWGNSYFNGVLDEICTDGNRPKLQTISVWADPDGGTISPSEDVTLLQGNDQTFTISPNEGYVIEEVWVDEYDGMGPISTYTFTNVKMNHTIEVWFKKHPGGVIYKDENNNDIFDYIDSYGNGEWDPSEETPDIPIPNAFVNLKQNDEYKATVKTDADGKYTLPPLDPGQYDIEVSYEVDGHETVVVKSPTVIQIPDQNNPDISIDYLPVNYGSTNPYYELWHRGPVFDKKNVVLVHGVQLIIFGSSDTKGEDNNRFVNLSPLLQKKQNGQYNVWEFEYGDSDTGYTYLPLENDAQYLAQAIQKVNDINGDVGSSNGVNALIAHSMGGIISRKTLQDNPEFFNIKLLTLSTGHFGFESTAWADDIWLYNRESVKDMYPAGSYLWDLNFKYDQWQNTIAEIVDYTDGMVKESSASLIESSSNPAQPIDFNVPSYHFKRTVSGAGHGLNNIQFESSTAFPYIKEFLVNDFSNFNTTPPNNYNDNPQGFRPYVLFCVEDPSVHPQIGVIKDGIEIERFASLNLDSKGELGYAYNSSGQKQECTIWMYNVPADAEIDSIRIYSGENFVPVAIRHGQSMIVKKLIGNSLNPLPGYTNPPTDPDGNGIHEDLNGNGRLDFADVVLYFNQMEWIAANEPVSAFDLNGNERIDFADIVQLFGEI